MEKNPWKKFLIIGGVLALIVGGIYGAAVFFEVLRRAGVPPQALGLIYLVLLVLITVGIYLVFVRRKNRQ